MKKTLGGDRLGSGGKISVNLHNYGRSTHNLSRAWRSSMAPGTLVPFLVEVGLNGDTFDIDMTTLVRTLPTSGPLYGSFKLQADIFTAPIRLYNKQLHNNKLGVGKDMSKVIFPQMTLHGGKIIGNVSEPNSKQINQSSLIAYLGTRGLGTNAQGNPFTRKLNGMPLLIYWDIFKNYYANKQENNAYYIRSNFEPIKTIIGSMWNQSAQIFNWDTVAFPINMAKYTIRGSALNLNNISLYKGPTKIGTLQQLSERPWGAGNYGFVIYSSSDTEIILATKAWLSGAGENFLIKTETNDINILPTDTRLDPFPLENIDIMREKILEAKNTEPFNINSQNLQPYHNILHINEIDENNAIANARGPMAGLAVKTYMSDRFNNWLSTEWIDGANGIAAISAVDTSSGSFTMDTLNLAKKVYDMLNRIAVSGGSYLDWQEAVYGEASRRSAETPIYWGGLSTEIMFNEVISTAETSHQDSINPLGTLAGRGNGHKNGQTIRVKIEEPSYIMGIVSITPRIDYSQGNKWFTRLETMDDLHKPALDGIGFQELITDEMAAWDTTVDNEGKPTYYSAGKQPAWIHYMTSQNETYGTFANENETMFMTLNRQYERGPNKRISDLTTYIDPSKYNYAFADTNMDAQNFWVQIAMDVVARRKMSAKAIPNL